MAIVIRNTAYDVIYEDHKPFMSRQPGLQLIEEDITVNESFGRASIKDIQFDGMTFGYGNIDVLQDIHVESEDIHAAVALFYTLKGDFDMYLKTGEKMSLPLYSNNLMFNPSTAETITLRKMQGIEVIGINFDTDKFVELAANSSRAMDRYVNAVLNRQAIFQKRPGRLTPQMLQVIQEIKHCRFTGGTKKLFLQSKGIELLALQSEQMEQAAGRDVKTSKLTAADRDRIQYARQVLLQHAQNPLSLYELAKAAGINEFKLKTGFKEMFDNTVFGYLNDHRLTQAQQMLRQDVSLSHIADELGYSSLQHFSQAFRKKFGLSPMQMRKA
ncbi:AraC family transcriptional regulator [Chitinophaga horti]|uniref:AraC family transcriptional regulator n=1 Tax=Chitinophaga horti TaxID=2920382 RepID=A0ABY6J7M0_9BACT|nr:AraC family transcriptional regulator [Chitinophaga horti]UYQ94289.1 AraC family transcriptional regulator [Chitinophaga horti]